MYNKLLTCCVVGVQQTIDMLCCRGTTKVIERDSSGFLSARTFDESTDRRSKDPFSRSTPGDRWSELRSARTEPGAFYVYL